MGLGPAEEPRQHATLPCCIPATAGTVGQLPCSLWLSLVTEPQPRTKEELAFHSELQLQPACWHVRSRDKTLAIVHRVVGCPLDQGEDLCLRSQLLKPWCPGPCLDGTL